MSKETVYYIDRSTGVKCAETVMGGGALNFAYNTFMGRSLWGLLFNTGFLSRLMGCYYDSKLSKSSIKSLIKIPGLNADEAERDWQTYSSFNDFFTRKLKIGARKVDMDDAALVSPADGRLLVYPEIAPDVKFPVKGSCRSLNELCSDKLSAEKYSVAVIRLAPVDYHRYHYPCDCCNTGETIKIAGKYHSVNPVAFKKAPDLFTENTRCVTPLKSPCFGEFRYLEIGAFGVGSIINTSSGSEHKKADEKGLFKFGGSTVILIMESGKIRFDNDLTANSAEKIETLIRFGEKIGTAV